VNPLVAPEPLDVGTPSDFEVALVSLNQWQLAWRRFRRHKMALFGSGLFLTMVGIAVFGPFIFPYNPIYVPTPLHFCPGSTTQLAYNGCPPLTRASSSSRVRALVSGFCDFVWIEPR